MKQKIANPWRDRIRAVSLKATPARLVFLRVLEKAGAPLTIDEIRVKMGETKADTATVYRMVKQLKEAGLIRQVDFEHNHAHYELMSDDDHHHLVCTSCDRVEDFTGCDVDLLAKQALKGSKQFASVSKHSLELFGLCKKCSN